MDKRTAKYLISGAFAIVLFIFIIWNIPSVFAVLKFVFGILSPMIIGVALAFILNKPRKKFDGLYRLWLKGETGKKAASVLSIITVYLLFFGILIALISIILPELKNSIILFGSNLNDYTNTIKEVANKLNESYNLDFLQKLDLEQKLIDALEYIPSLFTTTLNVTTNIIGTLADLFFGIIFSIYIQCDKDKLKRNYKSLIYVNTSKEKYQKVMEYTKLVTNTFSQFINGQIIEAFILGILCFIGMNILGGLNILSTEYAFLISVIVALTNFIPIIGPIVGVIPCAFLMFLIKPMDAVWFVIFIIILQQFEANVIYPRVVGSSVGLPSLWVLFAVIVGGGLFGVIGMILGIPIMSIAYVLIDKNISKKMTEKAPRLRK